MERARQASQHRKTAETDISITLDIDGAGESSINTGIGFFDHMLTLLARHGLLNLSVEAKGDLEVDYHHTVEDVGIVLGQCVKEAVGDKQGIARYGWCYLPMDETLARVVIDLSGRSFLEYRPQENVESIGGFSYQLVEEFLRAFAHNVGANLHVEVLYGRDGHHMAEAIFKGLAKALDAATKHDPRVSGVPSTKEML